MCIIADYRTRLSTALSWIEGLILLIICIAFWHHSPPIRDKWVWLLLLAVPVFGLRVLIRGRLWRASALVWALLPLIPLSMWNFEAAPLARQEYWVLAARPLFGIWLVIYCAELAPRLRPLLLMSVGTGITMGVLALTASQWTSKSDWAAGLIALLPQLQQGALLPDMLLSFNVNEIAGALVWMCPLLFALAAYPGTDRSARLIRWGAGIGALLGLLALFLGQSRFAIAGLLLALVLLTLLLSPGPRWRWASLAGIALLAFLQFSLLLNLQDAVLGGDNTEEETGLALSQRDLNTSSLRLKLWDRALQMIRDEPLTGVGMSMYRSAITLPQYEIEEYTRNNSRPPHAHNEWLQMGTDLGLPGLALFVSWQIIGGVYLWRAWRSKQRALQVLAVGLAAGLSAHAVYGTGDAVTLWDRYAFLFWWMLGLLAALGHTASLQHQNSAHEGGQKRRKSHRNKPPQQAARTAL